jgi:hypothetical protein
MCARAWLWTFMCTMPFIRGSRSCVSCTWEQLMLEAQLCEVDIFLHCAQGRNRACCYGGGRVAYSAPQH